MIEWLTAFVLGAVLVWTLLRGWEFFSKPHQPSTDERGGVESRPVIAFTAALFMFAYISSTLLSMTFFDAATPFELRIIAPVFVCLLILLAYFGMWLKDKRRELVIVLTLILLGFTFYKQSVVFERWSRGGMGYASFQWYDSQAMAFLQQLPEDIVIYTNEPGAVYLYTGRGASVLPDRYDSATAQVRTGFEEGVARMQAEVLAGRAVIALFDTGDTSTQDTEAFSNGLYLAHDQSGDQIYTANP